MVANQRGDQYQHASTWIWRSAVTTLALLPPISVLSSWELQQRIACKLYYNKMLSFVEFGWIVTEWWPIKGGDQYQHASTWIWRSAVTTLALLPPISVLSSWELQQRIACKLYYNKMLSFVEFGWIVTEWWPIKGGDQYQHASTWIWRSAVTTLALLPPISVLSSWELQQRIACKLYYNKMLSFVEFGWIVTEWWPIKGGDQYQHASTWIWRSAVTTLALLPPISVLSSWEWQQRIACKLYYNKMLSFVEFGWIVTEWWPIKGGDQYQHASTWIWRSAVTTLALLPPISVLSSWELQQRIACKLYYNKMLSFVEFGWIVTEWWPIKGGDQYQHASTWIWRSAVTTLALLPPISVLSSWELQQRIACKLYYNKMLSFVEFGWIVTEWWPIKGGYQYQHASTWIWRSAVTTLALLPPISVLSSWELQQRIACKLYYNKMLSFWPSC